MFDDKFISTSELPTKLVIPRKGVGRPSAKATARYETDLAKFCAWIRQIDAALKFKVSARGFGYILENKGLITKIDFDKVEKVINDARKSGALPTDICAQDQRRAADNVEDIHYTDPDKHADSLIEGILNAAYTPFSFWEDQVYYVEMMVEKVDLKSLFATLCAEYAIPITNAAGWNDINSRVQIVERFKYWESLGKRCALLYCGDFDPAGLQISSKIKSNLNDLSGAVGWSPKKLTVDRFGLNEALIEELGLTWIDNLQTSKGEYPLDDPRHRDHTQPYVQDYLRRYGVRKVEANALVTAPEAGEALCRDAINRYVPEYAPGDYRTAIAPRQEELRQIIERRLGGAMDKFGCSFELDRKARKQAYVKAWRAQNPDRVRDQALRARAKHRDRDREYGRLWRERNPEKVAEYNRRHGKKSRRARWEVIKIIKHAEARDQFELERALEERRHLEMKAAQLRRSIIRDG